MKVSKDILENLSLYGEGHTSQGWRVVEKEFVTQRRWSLDWRQIIQNAETQLYYETFFSTGATESQDEGPYDDDDDEEIELREVFPRLKDVTVYAHKKPKDLSKEGASND